MIDPVLPTPDLTHVLTHTRELWENLRGARLFITGGTGFFGTWILESFAGANRQYSLGATATVLTRNPQAFATRAPHLVSRDDITFLRGDVTTFAFPPGPFSHVIHAATEASAALNEADPLRMSDVIVGGTRRMLEFARAAGAQRFLLTSSGGVYGRQPPEMTHIPEDFGGGPDVTDVRSAYAESKRLAEWYCAAYARQYGLHCTIARGFAFVGPHLPLNAHFAIGNFIRDAIAGREIVVNGDGTPYRSYLYASDLAIWLWTILLKGESCRPYNVGSDQSITIAELAALVSRLVPGTTTRIMKRQTAGRSPERYVPNIDRAARELNLVVRVGLTEAIERTLAFAREQSTGQL